MTTLHEFRGVHFSMKELAEKTGIPLNTLYRRIRRYGWTIEQAVLTPTPKQRRRGVVFNFEAFAGTGAGGIAQEIPEISFSKQEHSE